MTAVLIDVPSAEAQASGTHQIVLRRNVSTAAMLVEKAKSAPPGFTETWCGGPALKATDSGR
jgi:hypothetical protein